MSGPTALPDLLARLLGVAPPPATASSSDGPPPPPSGAARVDVERPRDGGVPTRRDAERSARPDAERPARPGGERPARPAAERPPRPDVERAPSTASVDRTPTVAVAVRRLLAGPPAARATVAAAEVLGAPRALRPYGGPGVP